MNYNEYWQIIESGMKADELIVFKYEDQGVATLEDGLYALEKSICRSENGGQARTFPESSLKGWDYAIKNQDQAVKIVLANDASGAQTEGHQKTMMQESRSWSKAASSATWNRRLRSHREDPAERQVGSGHQQETARRVYA